VIPALQSLVRLEGESQRTRTRKGHRRGGPRYDTARNSPGADASPAENGIAHLLDAPPERIRLAQKSQDRLAFSSRVG
jgi:hypothetical protein